MSKEQFRIDGQRVVLYANPVPAEDGYYYPSFVSENEPFHRPTDWRWGKDFAIVVKCCNDYNAKNGYTETEALEVIANSVRLQLEQRRMGVRAN